MMHARGYANNAAVGAARACCAEVVGVVVVEVGIFVLLLDECNEVLGIVCLSGACTRSSSTGPFGSGALTLS